MSFGTNAFSQAAAASATPFGGFGSTSFGKPLPTFGAPLPSTSSTQPTFSFGAVSKDNPFGVAPIKKATQTDAGIPVAAHLRSELHSEAPPAEMVTALESSRCHPLDADAEAAMKEKAENEAAPFPLEEFEDDDQSPRTAPVVILDLSSSPPREVDSISAFGLVWAPTRTGFAQKAVKQIRRATEAHDQANTTAGGEESKMAEASSSSSSTSKPLPRIAGRSSLPASVVTPSMLPMESEDPELVQFYSIESALFSAPSSAALGRYQQQMLQLPAAIAANKVAMAEAESKQQLGDIGALYIERKRLQAELKRMRTEVPPQADVIEVRDTMSLPYGLVPIGKQIYYLMRGSEREAWTGQRKLVVSNIHPKGKFKPSPFADAQLGFGRVSILDSKVFQQQLHGRGLAQAVNRQRIPIKQLLYRGTRDGFNGSTYHAKVDNQGPTLTLVRTKEPKHTFFVYIAESTTSATGQLSTDAFIVCFGTEEKPLLTKLEVTNKALAIYQQPGYFLYVGSSGYALNMSATCDSQPNSTFRSPDTAYACAKGFPGQTWNNQTLAGGPSFLVDEMEVYSLESPIDHTGQGGDSNSSKPKTPTKWKAPGGKKAPSKPKSKEPAVAGCGGCGECSECDESASGSDD